MLKIKEEFDYKSLSRRLDIQLDKLIADHERQQKAFEDEIERINVEAQNRISEAEKNYAGELEVNTGIHIIQITWSVALGLHQGYALDPYLTSYRSSY